MPRRPVQIVTNSFEIRGLPRAPYFHFDMIEPESKIKSRNFEIVAQLVADNAQTFNPRPIYDGKKNLFSLREFPSGTYMVYMGRDKTKATHQVTIKRVSIINPVDVQKLTRRLQHGDSLNAMSLNLFQLMVRQAPNMTHGFPADARSFYVAMNSRDLRNGLSAWRGFFQSIRPTLGRVVLNIDVSHAAVYTPGPLINTMMQFLNTRDVRSLQNPSRPDFARLKTFLKGLRIKVNVSNMRPKPIQDLVENAGDYEFDRDGERLTVRAHFESKYNKRVHYPHILGVRVGKTAVIPAEFCEVVPGQVYRKKLGPEVQKQFLEFATQKPHIRMNEINGAIKGGLFAYEESDFLKDAGMTVGDTPITISGDLMSPPPIKYGGNATVHVADKAGSWNLVGKTFLKPAVLKNWAVVVFGNPEVGQVQAFVSKLVNNMKRLGMTVPIVQPHIQSGQLHNPLKALDAAADAIIQRYHEQFGSPQLFLVILPQNAADCRRAVKHWGDVEKGVATQCVRSPKWGTNDQYCNNVALKINARLGGTNSAIDNAILCDSMVIGADVGHPSPGVTHRPSVTGLVASVDPQAVVMTSAVSIQEPRVEIIQDLKSMVSSALNDWKQWRGKNVLRNPPPPKNIIFFRDGVSEGEFSTVAQEEVTQIEEAFQVKGIPRHIWPKIVFIVVGKRHHVRFFPQNPSDADRSGNCPAGLLVDKQITNPNYEDFYLQSHAGLLGTSRPAHYIIIKNDTSISKEQIQELSFQLCHTYASATRSVSIPAPVYYADKICSRLEFHCKNGASLSDTASNVTGQTEPPFDLAAWKEHCFKNTTLGRYNYFL